MSKEEFYKYGESLGIKINDLQRLKMLADACNDNKYTAEDMLKCWDASKIFGRPISEGYAPNFNEFINSLNKQD